METRSCHCPGCPCPGCPCKMGLPGGSRGLPSGQPICSGQLIHGGQQRFRGTCRKASLDVLTGALGCQDPGLEGCVQEVAAETPLLAMPWLGTWQQSHAVRGDWCSCAPGQYPGGPRAGQGLRPTQTGGWAEDHHGLRSTAPGRPGPGTPSQVTFFKMCLRKKNE